MRTIKLTISYDGTNYSGWQIQPNGVTIQELLQKAVRSMTGEENNVIASGRTDAGVHALAQVVSFKTEKKIPLEGFKRGINTWLPSDIRAINAEEVTASFHPIRDSKSKHYRYIMIEDEFESPLERMRSWAVGRALDIGLMKKAASSLVGVHDFSSFRASDAADESREREIFSVSIEHDSGRYYIDIKGNGFLKHMVRNIVGTLYDVGIGKTSPDEFKVILEEKDRTLAGITAPPQGLYLVHVEY